MDTKLSQTKAVTTDEAVKPLEAPLTLSADQLEDVAGGLLATLLPGRIGPTNGLVYNPE
jgi:hypothetical protein